MRKLITLGIVSAAALAVTTTASAGWFVGGQTGLANIQKRAPSSSDTTKTTTTDQLTNGIGAKAITQIYYTAKTTDTWTGRLFGGYNFGRYFGLEVGGSRYGHGQIQWSTALPRVNGANLQTFDVSYYSADVLLNGYLPVGAGFSLFAKAGIAAVAEKYIQNDTFRAFGRGNKALFARPELAAGFSYNLTQNWKADFTADRIWGKGNINAAALASTGGGNGKNYMPNINTFTAGLEYDF